MDELPSATFRKVYVRLTAPVSVTSNGHVIGTYIPAGADVKVMQRQDGQYVLDATIYGVDGTTRKASAPFVSGPTFGTSRPAPKPGRGKA